MASPSLAPRLTLRAPADPHLLAELDRLERTSLRVLQLFGAFGTASAFLFALVSPKLGLVCAVAATIFTTWFFIAHRWLESGKARRALQLMNIVAESAVPWTFLAVLALAEGTDFAIASWVPPMIFSAQIVAATVRLRPGSALIAGLLGGVAYPLLSIFVLRGAIQEATARTDVLDLATLFGRSTALLVSGVLGALIASGLFSVYRRAETSAREQDLFGKYRLLRPLASGAMGTVIEALYCPEGGFERRVAVKRVHSHLAELDEFVDAFRREAELGSRLLHPNIVQVLDFGRVGRAWFLAMEYVDGVTLHDLMSSAPNRQLPPHVAGFIARELLAALDHAHEGARAEDGRVLRIVHRDLCPKNVLVSISGEVKVSDYGVARALGVSAMAHTRVTGHAGYVAPEQARAEPIDVRADLFPVGVILWELLAGRRLFERDNEAATLQALLFDPTPALSSVRPDLDRRWSALVERALERDPALRYESAAEMTRALEEVPDASADSSRRALARIVRELRGVSLTPGESLPPPPPESRPSASLQAGAG